MGLPIGDTSSPRFLSSTIFDGPQKVEKFPLPPVEAFGILAEGENHWKGGISMWVLIIIGFIALMFAVEKMTRTTREHAVKKAQDTAKTSHAKVWGARRHCCSAYF